MPYSRDSRNVLNKREEFYFHSNSVPPISTLPPPPPPPGFSRSIKERIQQLFYCNDVFASAIVMTLVIGGLIVFEDIIHEYLISNLYY